MFIFISIASSLWNIGSWLPIQTLDKKQFHLQAQNFACKQYELKVLDDMNKQQKHHQY
jgi:hypothetical protein